MIGLYTSTCVGGGVGVGGSMMGLYTSIRIITFKHVVETCVCKLPNLRTNGFK